MPPTSELNATGRVFEGLYKHVWKLFREGKFDESAILAHRLLVQPRLGDVHRAGMHLLLANADDCYIEHATEALRLYENLEATTPTEQASKDRYLLRAKEAVRRAEQDEAVRSEQAKEGVDTPGDLGDIPAGDDEPEFDVEGGIHEFSPGEAEVDFPYEYADAENSTHVGSTQDESTLRRPPVAVQLNASTDSMMEWGEGSEPDLEAYLFENFPEAALAEEIEQGESGEEVVDGGGKSGDNDKQIPTPAATSDAPLPSSEF